MIARDNSIQNQKTPMEDQKKQLISRLKEAQNVLVTVSKNPSVDQLASAIGLTLALNKLDKHATAVYSGATPSVLEFLRPEETLEPNTDSLRDFIIALDKSKADKLRYKVEDEVVRIFITPYHTAISDKDLDFSQGDFNVEVVVALGVHEQQDLDDAIQAHGRILHDATVASISIDTEPDFGSLHIVDTGASSLAEIVAAIVQQLGKDVFDEQIATSFLTGIVAMTDRFGNDRTTPQTMSVSASLMSAGANQQLVAAKLTEEAQLAPGEQRAEDSENDTPDAQEGDDPGTLDIHHETPKWAEEQQNEPEPSQKTAMHSPQASGADQAERPEVLLPEPATQEQQNEPNYPVSGHSTYEQSNAPAEPSYTEYAAPGMAVAPSEPSPSQPEPELPAITTRTDRTPMESAAPMPMQTSWAQPDEPAIQPPEESYYARERMVEPPSRDGTLTANTAPETPSAPVETLTQPAYDTPILNRASAPVDMPTPPSMTGQAPSAPEPVVAPSAPLEAAAPQDTVIDTAKQTLSQIEAAVDSPHTETFVQEESQMTPDSIDNARNLVDSALSRAESKDAPEPIQALNALPLSGPLHEPNAPVPELTFTAPVAGQGSDQTPATEVAAPEAPQLGDMNLPPVPASPSVFPGAMPASVAQDASLPAPPPVPPPPLFGAQ